jgi:signal peptidase II
VTAAGLGASADLLSKHFVFAALLGREGHRATVIPGVLRLTLSTNPGIVFGIRLPGPLVPIATLAMVAVVILLFASSSRRFWGLHLGLGMVLGGALGNAYDRLLASVRFPDEPLARTHQVRDFIDVYVIGYPVFNVADILLVIGVGLIILHMLRGRRAPAA